MKDHAKDFGFVENWVGHLLFSDDCHSCIPGQTVGGGHIVGCRPKLNGGTVVRNAISLLLASKRKHGMEVLFLTRVIRAHNGQVQFLLFEEPLGDALDIRGGDGIHVVQNLIH